MSVTINEDVWTMCLDSDLCAEDRSEIYRGYERHSTLIYKRMRSRPCLVEFWKGDRMYPRFLVAGACDESFIRLRYFYGLYRENADRPWRYTEIDEADLNIRGFTGYTVRPLYGAKKVDSLTLGQVLSMLHLYEKRRAEELSRKTQPAPDEPETPVPRINWDSVNTITIPTATAYRYSMETGESLSNVGRITINRDSGYTWRIDPSPNTLASAVAESAVAEWARNSIYAPTGPVTIGTYDRDASVLDTLTRVLDEH